MKSENKQLLLQDLCARLPYGVKCQFEYIIIVTDGESSPFYNYVLSAHHLELFMRHNNFYIKPYLRPMSSMTEEEYEQIYIDSREKKDGVDILDALANDIDAIDWLNAHHFDYRGLVDKGLALSTDEFDPYND